MADGGDCYKVQIRNKFKSLKLQMTKTPGDSQYDLDDRNYEFARRVRVFVKRIPRTICNTEDIKHVVRSSGSVGANHAHVRNSLTYRPGKPEGHVCASHLASNTQTSSRL